MVSDGLHKLCTNKESVSTLLAEDPTLAPGDAWKRLYGSYVPTVKKAAVLGRDSEEHSVRAEDLQRIAECGNWGPSQPSELFLKIYHDALGPVEQDIAAAMVSPSLMSSCGVVPLTIISVVPDIMRHMSNMIVRAEKEVFLATNYWQNSVASTYITNAMKELSARAGKRGEKIVMKIIYDRGSPKQLFEPHYIVSEKEYLGDAVNIPKPEEIPNIDLQVMNYHKPMLGTYHCKYMVVDRKYAVLQSNNIQDNDNMEMMIQLEGPIVDSLYDMALISWHKALEPPLSSYNSPAAQSGIGSFGETSHHAMFQRGDVQANAIPSSRASSSGQIKTADTRGNPLQKLVPGEDAGRLESERFANLSSDAPYKPSPARNAIERAINAPHLPPLESVNAHGHLTGLNNGQKNSGRTDAVTNAYLHAGYSSLPSSIINQPPHSKPLPEHMTTDPHYDIDIAGEVARVQQSVSPNGNLTRLEATAAHLNHTKNTDFPSSIPEIPAGDEFTPYIPHAVHEPFPIAMVNRPPYGTPKNSDVYTPQNEAWLAGLRYAKKNVFIQSPTLNAEPILKGILNACERGVDVFAFICIGYNDAGELLPMQGGTNEMVSHALHESLSPEGLKHLHYHFYVGADQTRPILAKAKKRSCHVKLMIIDEEIGIQGNGNQDSQSWYHSQEINVMLQSKEVCGNWIDGLRRCQRTERYGKVDDDGVWRDAGGKEVEGAIGTDPGKFSWIKGIAGAVRRVTWRDTTLGGVGTGTKPDIYNSRYISLICQYLTITWWLHGLQTVAVMAEVLPTSAGAPSPPAKSPHNAASPPSASAAVPQDFENEHLPIESDESDIDSGFGSDIASSTTSILDSIRDYRVLNGRTYHNFNDTQYCFPNDDAANEAMDIGHQLFTLLFDGRLFLAPIGDSPQKAIDIGTGTGIWAIDFADQFPSAEVIGTDLSPTQPSFVPPNLRFELDDAQLDWTFNEHTFDYVHLRCLFGSISDWPKLYNDAFRAIKPGGWIEQVEINVQIVSDDGTVDEDHILTGWSKPFFQASEIVGKSIRLLDQTKELMLKAGFTNVVQRNYKVPIGAWSSEPKLKEVGRWSLLFCLSGMESWAMYMLINVLMWKVEDVNEYLAKVKAAFLDKKNHGYYVVGTVYGQKPL
ncbi:hypothetical protein V493_05478 [Pseudogymnoascus sp. VKM F-4281 (FW-2241)]|nr:hypothetical protein V493_05478 [Pseudogymnoascus sp. VKM F-4281 (FW-2241)]